MSAQLARPVVAVFGLAAVATGACLAYLFIPAPRPSVLQIEDPIVGEAQVTTRQFVDERTVSVAVTPGGMRPVRSPVAGRITSTTCAIDGSLDSGTVPLSLDGEPLLALSTAVPLWRDLSIGSEGPDVVALQQELIRLGFPVAADGELGTASLHAVASLRNGDEDRAAEIRSKDILWVPSPSNPVAACVASLGDAVEAGDPLLELLGGGGEAAVQPLPSDLMPGDRQLIVGDLSIPVEPDGRVLDPAGIAALVAASLTNDKEGDETTLTAVIALREAVSVGVVPPRALYDLNGDEACLMSRNEPVRVRLVSSQLGETFISASDGHLPATVEIAPEAKPPCS